MKVLHIGKEGNMERFSAAESYMYQLERVDMPMGLEIEEYLEKAGDADFIVADAIAKLPGELIRQMPRLKLIHSEGVACNSFDLEAARECGVYVCNSAGMNASAVAEMTLLLMVGMLRDLVRGDQAVRQGRQIQTKEGYMIRGDLKELADMTVGLVGFGAIARSTARLLAAYGVERILCCKQSPLTEEEKSEYGVIQVSREKLLAESDIVSLHLPVTAETMGMADEAFFAAMKDGSYFVNTARGELVDDRALTAALAGGKLTMAAIDTLDHEPVQPDHPMINLPDELAGKIIFAPHIGGITNSSFKRSYKMIWEDVQAAAEGREPKRIVSK